MSNNVVALPYDDLAEASDEVDTSGADILDLMGDINQWCSEHGVNTDTKEYKHQAAVIMTQFQIILMSAKR